MTAIQDQVGSCDVRMIESASGAELYITATPRQSGIQRMYRDIASVVRDAGASIVEERLFAAPGMMSAALADRRNMLGELDDGVTPTLLVTRGESGRVLGSQVHAICGIGRPKVLRLGGVGVARTFECEGYHYLTGTGLRAAGLPGAAAQARRTFEMTGDLMTLAGGSIFDLARTWIWMDDVLAWYGDLNRVRTEFFTERGLMSRPGSMPASTGIGVSPLGARVAMDLFAAWGKPDAVTRFHAAGKQRSAYEYGSAFARAARVKTPGGTTVYCSGTAAIDPAGKTCFVNDVAGQVRMTIENVQAVLRDTGCGSGDVVQAMAYCSTPTAEEYFVTNWREELGWPCLSMIGDVCRADLLFEIEVTACPGARH